MKIRITDKNGAALYTAGKYLTEDIEVSVDDKALPPATRLNKRTTAPDLDEITLNSSDYTIIDASKSYIDLYLDESNVNTAAEEFVGEIRTGKSDVTVNLHSDLSIAWIYKDAFIKTTEYPESIILPKYSVYMFSIMNGIIVLRLTALISSDVVNLSDVYIDPERLIYVEDVNLSSREFYVSVDSPVERFEFNIYNNNGDLLATRTRNASVYNRDVNGNITTYLIGIIDELSYSSTDYTHTDAKYILPGTEDDETILNLVNGIIYTIELYAVNSIGVESNRLTAEVIYPSKLQSLVDYIVEDGILSWDADANSDFYVLTVKGEYSNRGGSRWDDVETRNLTNTYYDVQSLIDTKKAQAGIDTGYSCTEISIYSDVNHKFANPYFRSDVVIVDRSNFNY